MVTYAERLERRKRKYATDEETRKKLNSQSKLYYQKHREEIKRRVKINSSLRAKEIEQYQRTYRQDPKNVVAANIRSKKYRENPENRTVLAHRAMQYFSQKYKAIGHSTRDQIKARWEYYGNRCWVCRTQATETDHVIPLSKGGSNWPANLRPICRSCNARKSNIYPYPSHN